jgi:hypothetical protein
MEELGSLLGSLLGVSLKPLKHFPQVLNRRTKYFDCCVRFVCKRVDFGLRRCESCFDLLVLVVQSKQG